MSTALPALLPSLTPLQEQHSEYTVGVAYRVCPIWLGELGWAGDDALGEWSREAAIREMGTDLLADPVMIGQG